MLRKLVKQGPATLMVSLPSKWVKRHDLEKGDEVNIEEIASGLVIELSKGTSEATLNINHFTESMIRTAIINAYRRGYDTIKINYTEEKQLKIIKAVVTRYIIGFEVVPRGALTCTLENLTEPSEDQFDVLVRKMFFNIDLLIQGTQARLEKGTPFDYADISLKIHQYDNFCRRVMSKKNVHGNDAPLYWSFLGLLVHGQRELYHLNAYLDDNPTRIAKVPYIEFLKTAVLLLREAYGAKNKRNLDKLHALEKDALNALYVALPKGGKESIVVYHLASSLRKFYLASSPLMGLLVSQAE